MPSLHCVAIRALNDKHRHRLNLAAAERQMVGICFLRPKLLIAQQDDGCPHFSLGIVPDLF
jgi:hypothetical protein